MQTTQITSAEDHFINALFVFGFSQYGEIRHFLKAHCHNSEFNRLDDILKEWQSLQPYLKNLLDADKDILNTIKVDKIPAKYNNLIDGYANDTLYKKTFSAYKSEFAIVEIDKLIVAQKTVDTDYCHRLMQELKGATDMENLLKLCLSPKRGRDTIHHFESTANKHVFSSPNPDLRFLGSFLKPITDTDLQYVGGGYPVAAIISFIGYGAVPVNAVKVGNRIILNNGFHRVYALRALGIKKIPIVIQNINNVLFEMPASLHGVPRDYLLHTSRPALMKDFFDENLVVNLKIKKMLKTAQVNITSSAVDIPF